MSSRPSAAADGTAAGAAAASTTSTTGSPPSSARHPRGGSDGSATLAAPVPPVASASPASAARAARWRATARRLPGQFWRGVRGALRHPFWRGLARLLGRLALLAAVLAVAIVLLVRFVLWPQAHEARQWLEQRASDAMHAQFTIGRLETFWQGWHPAFRARDVRAVDDRQRVLLAAGTVDGTLAWQSLAGLSLQFASLKANGTDVLIRRTPEGALMVAGVPVETGASAAGDDPFLNWLMSQGQLELTGGNLRWLDERAGLPQLDVADIHFSALRDGGQHTLRLEARSTSLAPQPLVIQASFRHDYLHDAGNWLHWNGQADWDFTQVQLPVVQRYLPIFDKVDSGTFSTSGTIDFRAGNIQRSQTRLRANAVDLQLTGAPAPLKLGNAQAYLIHSGDRAGNNRITIDTLLWQTEPLAGPPSASDPQRETMREGMRRVVIDWNRDRQGVLRKFALKAPTFDLNTVRALATSMPIDTELLRQLRVLQPAGHIDNLDVAWSREPLGLLDRRPGEPHYTVQGTLRGVSVNGQPAVPAIGADGHPRVGTPGFIRLSGNFSFDDRQGSARIDSAGATLIFPGLFEEPRVPFDELRGEVRWAQEHGKLVVRTEGLRFANADLAGTVRGNWRAGGDGKSGIADLSGELTRAQAARVVRYLPLSMPNTRHYLAGALVSGDAIDTKFMLRGDLYHFPFQAPHEQAGDFRVDVPLRRVSYQVAPHELGATGARVWPDFSEIDGHLVFQRNTMSFLVRRAAVHGIPGVTLHDVSGQIDDLSDHGHLHVEGTGQGTLSAFLRYIAASPVRRWTGGVADEARGQGSGELKIKLDMPLDHAAGTRVDGQFRFPGNDLVLMPELPPLGGTTGAIAFDEHGFRLDSIRGRFIGGEVRLAGGTQPDGATRVTVAGNATAAGVREALAGSDLAGLGARLDGSTPYNAVVGVRDQRLQVQVASELNGMAINLPAPLAKSATQEVPLRFELRPLAQAGAPAGRGGGERGNGERASPDEMLVQYGNALSLRYVIRRGETTEVIAGGIGLLQAAPQPASGVVAAAHVDHVDVAAWHTLLGGALDGERAASPSLPSSSPASSAPASASAPSPRPSIPLSPSSPGGNSGQRSSPFLPERIMVRARTVDAFGRNLDDVTFEANRERGGWDMKIGARQASGTGQWRRDANLPAGALTLRLSRLDIPDASEGGEAGSASHAADTMPTNLDELPAVDLVVDQFILRGHNFGKVAMRAHTAREDNQPVWTLDQLTIEQPGGTLTGSGSWRLPRRVRDHAGEAADAAAGNRRTLLNFQLDIRDAGALLDRMGLPHTLRDGHGKLEGRVLWHGSPLSIDYPTLSGKLSLQLDNGQILSVDPGAARLLGVLSLQSLLRFATLDFRSVTGRGTVFDEIAGNGTIENGVGTIESFRMKSNQVLASMTGSANLLRETQDLDVEVIPRINAATTSVAAAFINPVLGIGTLAAQLLFADEFSKVFTQHYRITGPWADPKVAKVEENKPRPAPVQDRSGAFPR